MYKLKNQKIEVENYYHSNSGQVSLEILLNGVVISSISTEADGRTPTMIKSEIIRETTKEIKAAIAVANIDIDFESNRLSELINLLNE